jgi:L-asparaginase
LTVIAQGIANIASAVQVARSDVARNQGVMVVFNEQIFAAVTVQKVHSQSVDAFAAPSAGPIGSMLRGTPVFFCQTRRPPPFPFKGLIEPVDLLTASVAADDGLLRASIERGARGLVLEAFGSGRVPPWWLPTMRDARARGIPIVITTRTGAGNLGDDYGFEGSSHSLREMGCLFASNLNGAKARIKLMAALAGSSPNGVAKYFQT